MIYLQINTNFCLKNGECEVMQKSDLEPLLEKWIAEHKSNEFAKGTVVNYGQKVRCLIKWLPADKEITKDLLIDFKNDYLQEEKKFAATTVNSYITAINKFMKWLDHNELCLKEIKIQEEFNNEDIITKAEYNRLLRAAKAENDHKLYFIMKILAETGIRIEELKYFTAENIAKEKEKDGQNKRYEAKDYIEVYNKGKQRKIIVRSDLQRELRAYARQQNIKKGTLFPSQANKGQIISKMTIWRHMKKLAGKCKIKKSKVHAHSFRHLFAQVYLEAGLSELHLKDQLGHKSMNTTAIYTRLSIAQQKVQLESMNFSNKKDKKEAAKKGQKLQV